jgi:hypothetical protein
MRWHLLVGRERPGHEPYDRVGFVVPSLATKSIGNSQGRIVDQHSRDRWMAIEDCEQFYITVLE